MQNYKFHPIADCWPLLEGIEYERLKESITEIGLLHEITILGEYILDGRNRYRACLETDTEPNFILYTGKDDESSLIDFCIACNDNRRHLTTGQRAMIAADLANMKRGGDGSNQYKEANSSNDLLAIDQKTAAKKMNISVPSLKRAKNLKENAPHLANKVIKGANLNNVLKQHKKDVKAKEIKRLIFKAKSSRLVTNLFNIDFRDFYKDIKFDFIITDPPYQKKYLDIYGYLGLFAKDYLKEHGSLLVMCGQSYLPEIYKMISQSLTYNWSLAYLTPGGQSAQLFERKVNTFWKPVLWFVNGKYKKDWIGDVCNSKINDNDKSLHTWGQSQSGMSDLMNRFLEPGMVICDPFMGAGTTGIISKELNCNFYGIEKDEKHFNVAKERLNA